MHRPNPTPAAAATGPIRAQYQALGVDGFYSQLGAQYRNPHFAGVRTCLRTLLSKWTSLHGQLPYPVFPEPATVPEQQPDKSSATDDDSSSNLLEATGTCWHMLDLAAGSGEATQVVNEWRAEVHAAQPGQPLPARIQWSAFDPYTQEAYFTRVGAKCSPISFQDIAGGVLDACESDPRLATVPEVWNLVICSFALHLIDNSLLFGTLEPLARRSRFLIVLSPSKKPEIKPNTGWQLVAEAYTGGAANNRVHGWLFVSQLCPE